MLSYSSYSLHVHFCKSKKNGYLLIPAAKVLQVLHTDNSRCIKYTKK